MDDNFLDNARQLPLKSVNSVTNLKQTEVEITLCQVNMWFVYHSLFNYQNDLFTKDSMLYKVLKIFQNTFHCKSFPVVAKPKD